MNIDSLCKLYAGEHRVYRDPYGHFVLDQHFNDPICAFQCRVHDPFYEHLRFEAECELGIKCEWHLGLEE